MRNLGTGRIIPILGFCVLTILVFLLFILGFTVSLEYSITFILLLGLTLLGLGYGIYSEGRHSVVSFLFRIKYVKSDLYSGISVFAGGVSTYFLSVNLGLGPVIASGLIGLLGAFILKKYAVQIFCGSFAGMASFSVFCSYPGVITASFFAGLLFVLSKEVFSGFGGRLGTIAFGGCLIASQIFRLPLLNIPVPEAELCGLIVFYAVLGSVLTYVINLRFGHGPVLSSAFIGVLSGLILPAVYGNPSGSILAASVFCASFIGMSSKARLPNEGMAIAAGFICGILFIFTQPHLGGAGGKLGTIAFGSVLAISGIRNMALKLYKLILKENKGP